VLTRLVEVVLPRRLGTGFRWLLASSWVSNLGDGIALSAGPLLVASQTHDPRLVSLAALLQWLPWLLFGLQAGALADRLNRRVLVAAVDLTRAGVLVLLCMTIATGVVSVPVVLGSLFLLGTAEVFADSASQTLLPMLVHRDDLPLANARLMAGFITINQLAGAPIGAALFAVGAFWPFVTQAVLVALGALLVLKLVLPTHVRDRDATTRMRRDIAEGFTWVLHHAAVRTLVLTIFVFNLTFGAAWSVLVLYAQQRLHLGAVGFGLITTCSAVGGLMGTLCYGWISRHVSLADLMRIGLVIETLTHLALAVTTNALVALAIFTVFGAHAFVWMTTSQSVRQRAVPTELQGRVNGVNVLGVYSTLVVGSAVGGPIAHRWGITAPFWFAFVGSALFVVLIWRQLRHIAHTDEQETAGPSPVASAS
jgi:predicted MFS family arabinose efflux permease